MVIFVVRTTMRSLLARCIGQRENRVLGQSVALLIIFGLLAPKALVFAQTCSSAGCSGTTTHIGGAASNPNISRFSVNGIINPVAYGAFPSSTTARLTATAGSSTGAVNAIGDFVAGQLVFVVNAGAVCALATPLAPSVTPYATAGYRVDGTGLASYSIEAVGPNGCVTPAGPTTTITNGNIILSSAKGHQLSWRAVTGAKFYKVYGCSGNACSQKFISLARGTKYSDFGQAVGNGSSPSTSSLNDHLFASITAINGSKVTLSANAGASGAFMMYHDSGTPIVNALAAAQSAGSGQGGGRVEISPNPSPYWLALPIDIPSQTALQSSACSTAQYGNLGGTYESSDRAGTTLAWAGDPEMVALWHWNTLHAQTKCFTLDMSNQPGMTALRLDTNATGGSGVDLSDIEDIGITSAHIGIEIGNNNCQGDLFPDCDASRILIRRISVIGRMAADTTARGMLWDAASAGPVSEIDDFGCLQQVNGCIDFEDSGMGGPLLNHPSMGFQNPIFGANSFFIKMASGGGLEVDRAQEEPQVSPAYGFWVPANSLQNQNVILLRQGAWNNTISLDSPTTVVSQSNNVSEATNIQRANIGGAVVVSIGDRFPGGWTAFNGGLILTQLGGRDSQTPTTTYNRIDSLSVTGGGGLAVNNGGVTALGLQATGTAGITNSGVTFAGLPTCNLTRVGQQLEMTDCNTNCVTYGATNFTGGASGKIFVICDGANWVEH
ncbi:MAG TPA: hypothetical protein VKS22_16400 [Candidatus Binataceae bacterium]|nr:hypothetical protein [Candidatus Binataceae bacterium]